jgi:hypothetical protein
MFHLYRPCGDSPRLRMPPGAEAGEEVHLNLAYRWFCRLDLDGKVHAFPVDRNQRRFQRFCFLRIAWAVPRNGETAWHSNEPAAILGKEWGKASAAQLNRNLNHAHKIWL